MKAKFGAIVVAGSGKIGGHVASKNRSGAYFRTRVVPSNPQTAYQQSARSLFSDASQAWASLTNAQREAWNNAKSLQVRTNTLGDPVLLSGKALYVSVYVNLTLAGEAPISSPVNPAAGFAFSSLTVAAAAGAQTITATFADAIPATHVIFWFATPSYAPGKSFVKNLLRKFQTSTDAAVSPLALTVSYLARFGSIGAAGTKISVTAVAIEIASGKATLAGSAVAIVGA